jgi:predicted phage tail protein
MDDLLKDLNEEDWIRGSGGGGGGGGGGRGGRSQDPPDEDPESLRSRSEASFLGIISEGEIEGFESGVAALQKTFLDGVPIQNDDGSYNFDQQYLSVGYRTGTQSQSALPGFDDVRIEQGVGVEVKKSTGSVSRTTINSQLSRLRVRIGISALYRVNRKNGDVTANDISFTISIRPQGGSNFVVSKKTINGKSRTPVDFEYEFNLIGTGPWVVEVDMNSADAADRSGEDRQHVYQVFFKAIVGILDRSFSYPNTALIGVKARAEGFTSVPRLSAELLGIKLKVPNNYNPISRSYSGVWNGTFKTAYSNNPAWVFYDLLTNTRYGAGEFVTENDIDRYSLYSIAQYCDQLVSNGSGGFEPRFTFNAYITNRGEAYEVLNAIAAAFRGMLYFSEGTIVGIQDKPKSMTRIFSPANVVQETDDNGEMSTPPFQYEGTARKARKTVALVSWNDPEDQYKTKTEYVEDRAGIERYGYRETNIRALGTTSQGQAQRIGRWTLLSDQLETEVVTFKVASEGLFILPGEIIGIADPAKEGKRYGGRVVSSTTSAITIDAPFTIVGGSTYRASVMLPNGTIQTRLVTNGAGSTSVLNFSFPLSSAPVAGAPWVLQENDSSVRKFRVTSLVEDDGIVTVLASLYDESKFSIADNNTLLSNYRAETNRPRVVPRVNGATIVLESYG